MSALLQWDDGGATVALEIDVATSEGFEATAEVTEHPVETGSAITDHVRPNNAMITLEGLITNTPVVVPRSQLAGRTRSAQTVDLRIGGETVRVSLQEWSAPLDRVRECDALLAALVAAGTPVRLTASLRGTTDALVITRYKVDRTADTGKALPVTLELKRLRVVNTSRVAVPALRRVPPVEPRGEQPAVEEGSLVYNGAREAGVVD